jgi:hypothetical protein
MMMMMMMTMMLVLAVCEALRKKPRTARSSKLQYKVCRNDNSVSATEDKTASYR